MSLRLKLILAFTGAFAAGIVTLGLAAIEITRDAIEAESSRRIDLTLEAIGRHPRFFITEATYNREQFEQIAAISGFHIVVPGTGGREVRGTSLSETETALFLRSVDGRERWEVEVGGIPYLAARAELGGRTFYLLSPLGSARRVEEGTRGPMLLVAVVGLLVAVLLAVVLSGGITRPLRRLAGHAREVREGRLDVEVPEGGGREVGELAGSFREMLSGLSNYREELVKREKLAALGRFSASVAHELRNPLSSIRMSMEMLRKDLTGEQVEDVDLLLGEISRLDHSIEELLFHAGSPGYAFADMDLDAVARRCVAVHWHLAAHLEVRLDSPGEGAAVPVRGDPARLGQAVTNLVLNGLNACGPGGRVEVAAALVGDRAVVTVRDTGAGPPAELAESLFEPFVSGREGGTGLGLTVTRAIARAHSGDVEFAREDFRNGVPPVGAG